MIVKDKKVSVMGLGRSGISAANFLTQQGAHVTVFDQHEEEHVPSQIAQLASGVSIRCGVSSPDPDSDLVVLSPGIDSASSKFVSLRQRGVEIIGELELACRLFKTPIIAITGTNGKSTTTTLVHDLLKDAGLDVAMGGNIGTPFCDLLATPPKDFGVIEVSSFQLETVRDFHPKIAAVLNLTPDHLNRHGSMEVYAELKKRITARQESGDVLVLNQDDPTVISMGIGSQAKPVIFSTKEQVIDGACLANEAIVLYQQGIRNKVINLNELPAPALYQLENILAALAIADQAGVSLDVMRSVLARFNGLEHRLEWVRTFNGIDFVNDSKGTNVGALEKSLSGFDRPVVLILGGQDKGSDFNSLKTLFKARVKHMVLIGEAKSKIRALLNGSFTYEDANSMQEAVKHATTHARSGDIVLLSPGCASFDMFQNFEDRGQQFKNAVHQL